MAIKHKLLIASVTTFYIVHLYSMNQYRSDYFGDHWYFLGGIERRISDDSLVLGGISFILFLLAFLAFRYSRFFINKFYILPGMLTISSLFFLYMSGQYVAVNCQECEMSEYFNRIKIRSARFECTKCNSVLPKFQSAGYLSEVNLISYRSDKFFKQLKIVGQKNFIKTYYLEDGKEFKVINALGGKYSLISDKSLLKELDVSAPLTIFRSPIIP